MIVQQKADNYKSGWIVTFLIIVREDGPSSGYVSTGFFGGKYLVTLRFLQESSSTRVKLFFVRSYFESCRLNQGDER